MFWTHQKDKEWSLHLLHRPHQHQENDTAGAIPLRSTDVKTSTTSHFSDAQHGAKMIPTTTRFKLLQNSALLQESVLANLPADCCSRRIRFENSIRGLRVVSSQLCIGRTSFLAPSNSKRCCSVPSMSRRTDDNACIQGLRGPTDVEKNCKTRVTNRTLEHTP